MRLFISINVPEGLHADLEECQKRYSGLKKTHDFHLTIQFLGDQLSEDDTETVIKSLKTIHFEPFEIELGDALPIPNPDKPRLVWVEADPSGALMSVADEIRNQMEELGYISNYDFSPHVTLGRYKKPPKKEPKIIQVEPLRFKADHFSLMESFQTERGHHYRELGRFGS